MHHVVIPGDKVPRSLPAINKWEYKPVKERERFEMKNGGFGTFPIVGLIDDDDADVAAVHDVNKSMVIPYFCCFNTMHYEYICNF